MSLNYFLYFAVVSASKLVWLCAGKNGVILLCAGKWEQAHGLVRAEFGLNCANNWDLTASSKWPAGEEALI